MPTVLWVDQNVTVDKLIKLPVKLYIGAGSIVKIGSLINAQGHGNQVPG